MRNKITAIIRIATLGDLSAITAIYNDAIFKTTATFDTEPKKATEQLIWFKAHAEKIPVLVAEFKSEVIGWASLNPYSDRLGYAETAEVSLYVSENHRGQGVGKSLLAQLIATGKENGLYTILARITEGNQKSIQLHHELGFETIGVLREVGIKFGKRIDVHVLQLIFKGKSDLP